MTDRSCEDTKSGGRNCFAHFHADARDHDPLNAYLLSLASAWVYPFVVADCTGCEECDIPALVKARMEHWGLDASTRLISRSAFGLFDTQAVVAAGEEVVLMVFRGSEHPFKVKSRFLNALRDWFATDADIEMITVRDFGPEVDVHRGFFRAFMAVADDIEHALQGPLAAGRRLWITGHSMGGALATLAVLWLCARGLPVSGAYTFGAPKPGGTRLARAFAECPIRRIHRYMHERDPIPGLPVKPLDYQHIGAAHIIRKDGSIIIGELPLERKIHLRHHHPTVYCKAFYQALTDEEKQLVPAPPTR